MWCGLPMKITRGGYSKVIEQLKAKLEKRNEERKMLLKLKNEVKKLNEGNDLCFFAIEMTNIFQQ